MSGGTCAHEGELVAMKAKIVEFWKVSGFEGSRVVGF